jgi:hypothetical protein
MLLTVFHLVDERYISVLHARSAVPRASLFTSRLFTPSERSKASARAKTP